MPSENTDPAAYLAVQRLAHHYAYALDYADQDLLRAIFTADARWIFADRPRAKTLDDILQIPARLRSKFCKTHHAIQTQYIDLSETTGHGKTYCMAYHYFKSDFVDEGRDTILIGHNYLIRYDDEFRCEEGVWKFSARQLNVIVRRVEQAAEIEGSDTSSYW